jgi:regulator of protease activity HflC (stomatin/prohibitin superfamily)
MSRTDDLDPAARSLAEALRVGFFILKAVMVILLVALLLSGTRSVQEGNVAVRLLFGALHGAPGERILEPGGPYLWPPEPIGEFVLVPTTLQRLQLHGPDAFWYHTEPGRELDRHDHGDHLRPTAGLVPGRDGSLLTTDHNIVHGLWTITYHVRRDAADDFVRHVGGAAPVPEMLARATATVRPLAQQAIVAAVARVSADDFVRSGVDREAITRQINERLRQLHAGLAVTQVLLDQAAPPESVQDAFQALARAESDRARTIDEARQEATSTLVSVAGEQHRALLQAIEQYGDLRRQGDAAGVARAEGDIADLLAGATGEASERLRAATLYRRTVEATIRAEAEEFTRLLPEYRRDPRIVLERRWQDTLQRLLAGDVETFYLPVDPDKELYLEIAGDPRLRDERERRRYREGASGDEPR